MTTLNRATLATRPRRTVSALAAVAFAEARAQYLAHQRRVQERADQESVHQARVALRKLRVYARLFRSRIGRARVERLGRELRWLFAGFGALRELQLFERDIVPLARTPAGQARVFAARVERRRAAAARELGARLQSARHQRLCRELASIEHALAASDDDKPAQRWLARRLARMHERMHVAIRTLQDDADSVHALRKRLKRFRYTARLAEACGTEHPKRTRRLRERSGALQDALGSLQDLQVARKRIKSLRPGAGLARRLRAELAAAQDAQQSVLDAALEAFASARSPWG